jgi:hypothetical protein
VRSIRLPSTRVADGCRSPPAGDAPCGPWTGTCPYPDVVVGDPQWSCPECGTIYDVVIMPDNFLDEADADRFAAQFEEWAREDDN